MFEEQFSIATITLARDEEEEELLRGSLQELAKLNIPVFVTDGGSRPTFVDFLQNVPNFILSGTPAKGVWQQAKTSLDEAQKKGSPFILYTEPDKLDFFKNFLKDMLGEAELKESLGILLASRSRAGFATFPAFQQMTETTINNCCTEVNGNTIDYTYGPFLLNSKLVPYLNLIQEDIGWGWRPFMFGLSTRLKYKIGSYVQDFSCPPTQQHDNAKERIYRIKQLNQNIQGIILSQTVELT